MKAAPTHHIFSVLQGGDFTGPDRKPMGRVTVDQHWNLNLEFGPLGSFPNGSGGNRSRFPIRWFASATNPAWKNETEVPKPKNIHTEASVDQDVATATIVIYNTMRLPLTQGGRVGVPGALTPDRGQPGNRWGHTTNEWAGALVEGAMLRTYQGFGGYNDDGTMKSIVACLAGEYIVQTGTWVIDDMDITSDGLITCQCRDMLFLATDQPCFPPLVPQTFYPVEYTRFATKHIVTPRVDYGTHVAGAKLIVGGAAGPVVTDATGTPNPGYWLSGDDGGVFAFGVADFKGSNIGVPTHSIIGITSVSYALGQSSGAGYWVAESNGTIFSFGAPDFGNAPPASQPYVDIASPRNVNGLYLVSSSGEVATKQTTFYGGTPVTPAPIVAIAARPDADGYWLLNANGQVYAYGSAPYGGNTPNNTGHAATDIIPTVSGNGYYIVETGGAVYTFGDAVYHGGTDTMSPPITDPISSMILTDDGFGYWLVAEDGGVFAFGSARFVGSLPRDYDLTLTDDGNLFDFSDMVRDFLLWGGFYFQGADLDDDLMPPIYGAIEKTGSYPTDVVAHDLFDKQPLIDCITKVKEVTGYLIRARADGSVEYGSPNWWGPGNFLPDGTHTTFIPTVDERYDLLTYGVRRSKKSDRSAIIISTDDPTLNVTSTVTTTYILPSNGFDRGIVNPAMIVNSLYSSALDQEVMAELIAMHIMFQRRLGSINCIANPLLDPDDQVQVFEEVSEEMWTHYLRGIVTDQDLDAGNYTAQLTTHWLGDRNAWAIIVPDGVDTLIP